MCVRVCGRRLSKRVTESADGSVIAEGGLALPTRNASDAGRTSEEQWRSEREALCLRSEPVWSVTNRRPNIDEASDNNKRKALREEQNL